MIDRRTFAAALAVLSLPSVAQVLDAQATPSALADIRAAAVNHPGWLYISRRCTDAQDLAALCRSFGWTSVAEVVRFADLMGKTFSAGEVMAMTPNSAPAIDRAALPVVQWGPGNAPIHSAIQQAFRTAIVPDQSDRIYRALTHAQIVALANAYRPRRAREDTTMDCDDYTRGYLGWLSENGYGNCSHGFLGYQAYDAFGRHLGAHAVTVSVDVDRRVWLVDHMPGSVGVWPSSTVRLGGFTTAARIEPTRVSF